MNNYTTTELVTVIDELIGEYKRLQLKAMDEDNVSKVNQFTGSMISLNVLKHRLGLDEEDCEDMED